MRFLACFLLLSWAAFGSTLRDDTFQNPSLLSVSAGVFDIVKNPTNPMVQIEYRSTLTHYRKARPLAGFFVTDKGSCYLFGGIGYDIFLSKSLVFMPSFAPGFYYSGKGKKLHFPLEFRSSAELAYVFKKGSRLGAQFYHISNASLGKRNPGVEALLLTYSLAL
jgi:lipid A 3-O-deacylase